MARTADPELAERRRTQILEAALQCFRRRGFHLTTMNEICAAAGLSAGALYRYYPAKTDLILAIAEDQHRALEELIVDIRTGEDLMAALAQVVNHAMQIYGDPHQSPLVADVMAEAMRDPELRSRLGGQRQRTRTHLAAAIARAQALGEVADDLCPDSAAQVITAVIDGLGLRLAFFGQGDAVSVAAELTSFIRRYLTLRTPSSVSHLRTNKKEVQETSQ